MRITPSLIEDVVNLLLFGDIEEAPLVGLPLTEPVALEDLDIEQYVRACCAATVRDFLTKRRQGEA